MRGFRWVTAAVLMAVVLSSSVKGEQEVLPAEDDLLPLESQQVAVVAKDDLQASATGECCLCVGVFFFFFRSTYASNFITTLLIFGVILIGIHCMKVKIPLKETKRALGSCILCWRPLGYGGYGGGSSHKGHGGYGGSHYDQGGYKGHQGYHADKGHKGSHYGDHGKAHYSVRTAAFTSLI
ncbi:uncharacterized protein LOC119573785 isoform X1 [Penaeus monodon]|uniref:uncharacterized protein LOC119573785 isoform X1 n=1 Tax=Penaeus monodon TaxID=6687 RepID=UPI0018A6DCC5|nr:uncharacterized protein LOC119573785 isoform X1 [Penaeus monodon]